jgi:hypothetical protein
MSGPFLFPRHGKMNPEPDYGLINMTLDWEELKAKDSKERDRDVVRRSNYYLYCMPLPGDISN